MDKKIKVGILGKGTKQVEVMEAQTIGDLRNILEVDKDVQCVDSDGKVLNDTAKVENVNTTNGVNFIPNVEGGKKILPKH
jgi:hypothetical protein